MGDVCRNEEQILALIGLGNPGKEYAGSRHNAGFLVLDRLIALYGPAMMERKFRASWGFGVAEGRKVLFVKPLTYMNLSGEAVGELIKYFGIPAAKMLVVHDDLDLPCARIRIAQKGGSGGHKGIQSIIDHIGGTNFPRLKIGVGRPKHGERVEDFVLLPPYPEEREDFEKTLAQAEEATRVVLAGCLSEAMNQFNRRD
ncbi:MAG: aminoacyl-tRNA hydrolase [Syntrophobacteraceae bacterium]|nr:aminoacyl-tRNA hydrolase [Syntrophobacteraceae bacterium]